MIAITHKKPVSAEAGRRELSSLDRIVIYLTASGPTRYWAVSASLADFGVNLSPEQIAGACEQFPGTFLADKDHVGPLIGIRTSPWMHEVSTRRSLDTRAAVKEQRLPRMRRGVN